MKSSSEVKELINFKRETIRDVFRRQQMNLELNLKRKHLLVQSDPYFQEVGITFSQIKELIVWSKQEPNISKILDQFSFYTGVSPFFGTQIIEENIHIEIIDRAISEGILGGSLLNFMSVLLKSGYQNEAFLERVQTLLNCMKDQILQGEIIPVGELCLLLFRYNQTLIDPDIPEILSLTCSYIKNPKLIPDYTLVEATLIQAIQLVTNQLINTIIYYPQILEFVQQTVFTSTEEQHIHVALTIMARLFGGDDEQTFRALYLFEKEKPQLQNRLINLIQNSNSSTIKTIATLTLANLFATDQDLLDTYFSCGTLDMFCELFETQTDIPVRIQLLFGLRNIISCCSIEVMAKYDVFVGHTLLQSRDNIDCRRAAMEVLLQYLMKINILRQYDVELQSEETLIQMKEHISKVYTQQKNMCDEDQKLYESLLQMLDEELM